MRSKIPEHILEVLMSGEMGHCDLIPSGSNYTFFTTVTDKSNNGCRVIYKPKKGEATLWDFTTGTLYVREYATYLLSEELEWNLVPPTVVRDGKFGIGSVQLFIDYDPDENFFTIREKRLLEFLRVCVFDIIINNADRKGGHCILDTDGYIWAIDHGVTFHSDLKLRTVIWDFAGKDIPEWITKDLKILLNRFEEANGFGDKLYQLVEVKEVRAFRDRLVDLIDSPVFPSLESYRSVPWPLL